LLHKHQVSFVQIAFPNGCAIVVGRVDGFAIDLFNDVAARDSGFGRGAAEMNGRHENAAFRLYVEPLRESVREVLNAQPEFAGGRRLAHGDVAFSLRDDG